MPNKSEWGIGQALKGKKFFIWHNMCEPTIFLETHANSFVSSVNNKCYKCGKEPPKYILFQLELLNGG